MPGSDADNLQSAGNVGVHRRTKIIATILRATDQLHIRLCNAYCTLVRPKTVQARLERNKKKSVRANPGSSPSTPLPVSLRVDYLATPATSHTNQTIQQPLVNGILAVSRAFGDRNMKGAISAEPDVRERRLERHDEFLVLATDGLWDVMTSQEACSIVCNCAPDVGAQVVRVAFVFSLFPLFRGCDLCHVPSAKMRCFLECRTK